MVRILFLFNVHAYKTTNIILPHQLVSSIIRRINSENDFPYCIHYEHKPDELCITFWHTTFCKHFYGDAWQIQLETHPSFLRICVLSFPYITVKMRNKRKLYIATVIINDMHCLSLSFILLKSYTLTSIYLKFRIWHLFQNSKFE